MSSSEMPSSRVVEVLGELDGAGIQAWVDGGWGIDALIRRQTRPHKDLDLVVRLQDVEDVIDVLGRLDFTVALDERPTRLELYDRERRKIGLHTVTFQPGGSAVQVLQDGTEFVYRREGFSGRGRIAKREVRCLTAEVQVECHLGYEPDAGDFKDMRLLRDHFGVELPPPYGDAHAPDS